MSRKSSTILSEIYSARAGRTLLWNFKKNIRKHYKRQPKFVVDNAMLRMKFQTSLNNPTETIAKQNSTVSKQAKLLPAKNGQYYNQHCSKNFPCLFKVTWNVLQTLFFLEKMSGGRLTPRMV